MTDLDNNDKYSKFKSLDTFSNTHMTSICTHLKSHPHKRLKIEPVTLIPITFIELKVKQENETYSTFKILDSGGSSTLITAKAVQHFKKNARKLVSTAHKYYTMNMSNWNIMKYYDLEEFFHHDELA